MAESASPPGSSESPIRQAPLAELLAAAETPTAAESQATAEIPGAAAAPAATPTGYSELLEQLKTRIHASQTRAAVAVNHQLVLLYWWIGREILERQRREGWGAHVTHRLSADLRREFPKMTGFSPRNLRYMKAFATAYPDEDYVQAALARIPWYHNLTLLEKVKDPARRRWYVAQTLEHGWSRNVLVHQIESGLFERQGRAVTNFEDTMPAPRSDLAGEMLKDPYSFDFLGLGPEARERDLEQGLIEHIQRFLLELGAGFAFVGRQVPMEVAGESFYLDLLFYHLKLRCFVVIELKLGAFRPEHAGKMSFYLTAVDELLRHPGDEASIGLVLCKTRKRLIVEWALRDLGKPVGVSSYEVRLVEALPEELRGRLPSIEELERGLGG